MQRIISITLILIIFLSSISVVCAQNNDSDPYVPTRYGGALLIGGAYDPDSTGLVLLQGQMLIDYDRVFWHAAPEALRLKLEVNGGLTMDGRYRGLFSLNMMALYYLENFSMGQFLPYIEGGIGAIYTDFQVEGQGSRINFNPQLGAGLEYPLKSGAAVTAGFRLHHISNGDLLEENRGINSALLVIGYLF